MTAGRLGAACIAFVVFFCLSGCAIESSNTEPKSPNYRPVLAVSPKSLDFGAQNVEMILNISNVGSDTLDWTISCDRHWIEAQPSAGRVSDEIQPVKVRVLRSDLEKGIYTGALTVQDAEGNDVAVTIRMSVLAPRLSIGPLHLDFGSSATEAELTIVNAGGDTLNWRLITLDNWITIIPTSGFTTRESDPVTVRINRSDLDRGHYYGEVNVFSDAGDAVVTVHMDVGRLLWGFYPSDNAALDRIWDCYDDNFFSGSDYWGVVTSIEDDLPYQTIWCNGRGEHPGDCYSDNMDAWMVQRSNFPADIRGHGDVEVRFLMKYKTESPQDYVRLCIWGSDQTWYYIPDVTEWSGSDLTWRRYIIPLNLFNRAPNEFLLLAFKFNSDISVEYEGAFIKDIEVWGD